MRRRAFLQTAALAGAGVLTGRAAFALQGTRPRPTRAQLQWRREELALFIHFGVRVEVENFMAPPYPIRVRLFP